jgi:DNA polymerase I
VRYIENLASKNIPLRMAALREAMNMPIQGTAADILKCAIVQLHPLLEPYHAKILLQVHDELVIETPKEHAERVQEIVQQTMEQIWPECQVPLPVSIGC